MAESLAEKYPPEGGPYRVLDPGTGHKTTSNVVYDGLTVLGSKGGADRDGDGEAAVDPYGAPLAPEYAQPKTTKKETVK